MRRGPAAAVVWVAALAVLLAGALALLVTRGDGPGGVAAGAPATGDATVAGAPRPLTAAEAGAAFLATYVDGGRVVRADQGGDTVSEGQAYAMLIAVGVGDQAAFTEIWGWTRQHLLRPDGLLSWRWAGGTVVDHSSAADADLDTARALVVAGAAFGDPALTAEGVVLGRAVLDRETVQTAAGRVLVAGDWAMTAPYAYNPSYASPVASAVLARASGDPRWADLDAGTLAVTTATLTDAALPPDWAQVREDGRVEAMPGVGGGGQSVRYGYDAARTPIRLAESCRPADRALAAGMLEALSRGGDAAELDLGGTPLSDTESVVAAVGQAAAVAAAGDAAGGAAALVDADRLQQRAPTYFGGAWSALGRLMLTERVLGGCPPAEVGA